MSIDTSHGSIPIVGCSYIVQPVRPSTVPVLVSLCARTVRFRNSSGAS
jgi:hypothetical protein